MTTAASPGTGYNPRLAELARLSLTGLRARWLAMNGTLPATGPASAGAVLARMSRDALIDALLDSGGSTA